MTVMSEGMKEIGIGIGTEIGWTTAMTVAEAREHAVEAEVQSESVTTGLESGSRWTETETGIESVIIVIFIGDESSGYIQWIEGLNGRIHGIADSLLVLYFAWAFGASGRERVWYGQVDQGFRD
jgi:hypothetical protein